MEATPFILSNQSWPMNALYGEGISTTTNSVTNSWEISLDFESYGFQKLVRLSIKNAKGARAGFRYDFDSFSYLKKS